MTGHWNFYMCRVDGDLASIYLDLGLAGSAPRSELDQLALVRVRMRAPREDGLSSDEEFDTLIALEEDLVREVEGAGSAVFAGRCTASGYRDFYFYTGADTSFDARVSSALERHHGYQSETVHRADPAWSAYFDFLYPDEVTLAKIRERDEMAINQQVREALAERGDEGDAPREIMHWAYFPDAKARDQYSVSITEMGFIAEESRETDDGRYSLRFSHQERPAALDPVTALLRRIALNVGGDYDGWECAVEVEPSRPD